MEEQKFNLMKIAAKLKKYLDEDRLWHSGHQRMHRHLTRANVHHQVIEEGALDAADELIAWHEGQAVAHRPPQDADQRAHSQGLRHRGQDVLLADHARVEQRQPRNAHQQHQGGRHHQPRGVARIQLDHGNDKGARSRGLHRFGQGPAMRRQHGGAHHASRATSLKKTSHRVLPRLGNTLNLSKNQTRFAHHRDARRLTAPGCRSDGSCPDARQPDTPAVRPEPARRPWAASGLADGAP